MQRREPRIADTSFVEEALWAWCRTASAGEDAGCPNDEVALLPLVPVAELGTGDVLEQLLEESAAVLHRQAHDVGGMRAEEEGAAAVHRVGADNRMVHRRKLGALLLGEEPGPDLIAGPGEVVDGDGRLDSPLQGSAKTGRRRACWRTRWRRPPGGTSGRRGCEQSDGPL